MASKVSLFYVGPEWVRETDSLFASPKLVLVGEAPGQAEEEQLRPFVGRSGQLLRKALNELGVDCYYLTNAVKVRPEGNRKPTKEEIESWSGLLEQELRDLSERYGFKIIALGESADWAMKCVHDYHYTKVWHPAYVLRTGKYENFKKSLKSVLENPDKSS